MKNQNFKHCISYEWLLSQGFETIEKLPNVFSLLALKINHTATNPSFKESIKTGECGQKEGLVVYYTNRCPFTDYYVNGTLWLLAQENNIPLTIVKLETKEQAVSKTAENRAYIREKRGKTNVEAFIPSHPIAEQIFSKQINSYSDTRLESFQHFF